MADRSVKVSLVLQAAGYMQGMEQVSRKTRETGTELEKLQQKREAFTQLGGAAVGFGAAVGVGIGMAVAKFAEFDQQMSYVQAATHATAGDMDLLRDAALEAGARTVYSATEAAAAIEELSKAGVSTADILGGALDGALDAAAAGGMDVAATAELMASALAQFNLTGDQASHVADLLAAGAGKAQGDMSDLGQALSQAGLVSNQFGLSIEETVGTLAAFANAGMMGSDAGTSLRTMLLRLANPTEEVKNLMAETGIQAYNAQGEFVGLDKLAGQLQRSLGGMTQAQRDQTLAMIFGQDAIRGANILLNEGTEGIQEWTAAVDDQGYAAETAAIRLDNLKGDWEAFTGALDTAMISMGEAADGPLRGLVQGLTGLVDGFNGLPEWMQHTAVGAGVALGAIALLGGGAMIAVPQIAAFKTALSTLGITAAGVRGRLGSVASFITGPFGIALAGAIALTAEVGGAHAAAQARIESYSDALAQGGRDAEKALSDLALAALQLEEASAGNFFKYGFFNKSALDAAEQMGVSLSDVQAAATGNEKALERVRSKIEEIAGTEDPWSTGLVGMNEQITNAAILADVLDQTNAEIDEAARLNEQKADAEGKSAEASGEAAAATETVTEATVAYEEALTAAEEALDALRQAIEEYSTEAYGIQEAHDNLNRAINDSVTELEGFIEAGGTAEEAMSGTTDAGIGLRDVMAEIDQNARESAVAILDNGGTVDEATTAYNRGRDRIVEMLTSMGVAPAEAQAWADKMYGPTSSVESMLNDVATAATSIPSNPTINLSLTGDSDVYSRLMSIQTALRTVTGNKSLHIATGAGGQGGQVAGNAVGNLYVKGKPIEFAAGGFASGIYPYTPGGIHKFAEAWDEAYITLQPSHRERSLDIWAETGRRLGAWQPSPASVVMQAAAPVAPDVYVQNPFTGEYLLAQTANIADGRIARYDSTQARQARAGKQVR